MRITLSLISIIFSVSIFAQTSIYSEGTKISIQKDALLYISGNLVMNESPNVNEATLVNTGTIRIGGDIVNNSEKGVFLDIGRPGPVVFVGAGNQRIISNYESYIPSIFMEKGGDSLIIEQSILRVDSAIRFNAGNLGHIMVGGNKIIMETNGFIVGERQSNRLVIGEGGSVEIEMPTLENIADTIIYVTEGGVFTGDINVSDSIFFQTPSGFDLRNLFGIGWGTTYPESAQGENGGTGVQVLRESTYTPASGQTQVANGVTADRLYRMNFFQKDDLLDEVVLHFFSEDLADVPTPRALYVSNDNGISWTKMDGGAFETNDSTITYTVANIPIEPIRTSLVPLITNPNASNLFVIAEAECNEINKPVTTVNRFSLNNDIGIDASNEVFEINICSGSLFELGYNSDDLTEFSWEFEGNPIELAKLRNDTISIGSISDTDEGLYTLVARNVKGCETSRMIQVNVWSEPVWDANGAAAGIGDGVPDFFGLDVAEACVGEEISFQISIVEDPIDPLFQGRIEKYTWYFVNRESTNFPIDLTDGDTFETPVFSYDSVGTYTVILDVVTEFGCTETFTDVINIGPNPEGEFEITDTEDGDEINFLCSGESFYLDPSDDLEFLNSDGSFVTFIWDLGDGRTSTFEQLTPSDLINADFGEIGNLSYNVTEDTDFTVTLTVQTAKGCIASTSQNIRVFAEPDPSFEMRYDGSLISAAGSCVGYPITLTSQQAQVGDLYEYKWVFNGIDGGFSNRSDTTVTFESDVLIDVSLVVRRSTTDCELQSLPQTLDIRQSPIISLGEIATFCGSTGILDPGDLPGNMYEWTDINGDFLENTPTYEVDAVNGDVQTINLRITNATGCFSTQTIEVTLNQDIAFDLGSNVIACGVAEIGTNIFASANYVWTKDGAPTPISNDSMIQVTESGDYMLSVSDPDGGCTNTAMDVITVTIIQRPMVDLGPDRQLCPDNTTTLDAGVHDSYQWSDGSTESTLLVSTPDLYWVIVTDGGCSSEREEILIEPGEDGFCDPGCVGTVDPTFTVQAMGIDITEACQFQEVQFISAAAQVDESAYDYEWTFENNGTSNEPYPVKTFADVDMIDVTLRVTSKTDGCFDEHITTLTITETPVSPYGDQIVFCTSSTTLDAGNQGIAGVTYRWVNGSDVAITRTFNMDDSDGDVQDIVLEIESGSGCAISQSIQVTLNGNIEIELGPNVEDCVSAVIGTNEFPTADYVWTRDGDPTPFSTDPIIEVTQSGEYMVSVTDNGGDCTNTATDVINVTIIDLPSINLGEDRQICSGELLTLNAGSFSSYLWSNGTTESNIYVNTTGSYWVEVTNAGGCVNRDSIFVEVRDDQIISPTGVITSCDPGCIGAIDASFRTEGISISNEVCSLTELQFISTAAEIDPTLYEFFWTFSDGTISIDPMPIKSFDMLGSIGVSLTVTSKVDGCTATTVNSVTVLETPDIPIGEVVSSCGSSITLDAENPGANYEWSDPITSDVLSTERTFNVSSTSEVPINLHLEISTSDGCIDLQDIEVRLNTELKVDLGPDTVACESIIIGSNEFPSATYLWSTAETTPTIEVNRSGRYVVRVTETSTGCVSEDEIFVQIEGLPNPDLGGDLSLCVGEVQTISPGNFASFLWSDGSTQSSLSIGSPGMYWVEVTNELGCTNRDTITVIVDENNPLDLPNETQLCSSSGLLLDAGVEAERYQWGSSTGFESTDREVTVNEIGIYWLEVEIQAGCIHRDTVTVIESTDQLNPSFLVPSVVGVGDLVNIVQLTEPLPEQSIWLFGDGVFSLEHNPIHQYREVGDYTITLQISNGGCTASVSKQISVVESKFEQERLSQELIELRKLKLYPNPIKDKVNLQVEVSTETLILVRVFTLTGLEVFRNVYEEKELDVSIDLSDQNAGLFLVNVEVGKTSHLTKIIKPE
ncbi:T9SS type A sorting domain-containing protein [Ekhidna sp.]